MKIYKQELPFWVNKPFTFELEGKIINFKVQQNKIVMYYEVGELTDYELFMIETGFDAEVDDSYKYYNTLMMFDGQYVLHCYVREK